MKRAALNFSKPGTKDTTHKGPFFEACGTVTVGSGIFQPSHFIRIISSAGLMWIGECFSTFKEDFFAPQKNLGTSQVDENEIFFPFHSAAISPWLVLFMHFRFWKLRFFLNFLPKPWNQIYKGFPKKDPGFRNDSKQKSPFFPTRNTHTHTSAWLADRHQKFASIFFFNSWSLSESRWWSHFHVIRNARFSTGLHEYLEQSFAPLASKNWFFFPRQKKLP